MSKQSKWKQGLLKTGLPLEYVVAGHLNSRGHTIFGEYPYIRPDETGEAREFSVDIRTHKDLTPGECLHTLSLLVECKYRSPGTMWIFAPLPADSYPIGIISDTEDFFPVRFHSHAIWDFENELGYCVGGVEVTSDGGGNTSGVKHGIFQLRFAMPSLLKQTFKHSLGHVWSDGRSVSFICPLLVTTAELRVIRPRLSLNDFLGADQIDDVTEVREAVIINEQPGPQLQEYAERLSREFIAEHPEAERRLAALSEILVGVEYESRNAPDLDMVMRAFDGATERILIVHFDALDKVLERLDEAIQHHLESEKVYGKLKMINGGLSLLDPEENVVAGHLERA